MSVVQGGLAHHCESREIPSCPTSLDAVGLGFPRLRSELLLLTWSWLLGLYYPERVSEQRPAVEQWLWTTPSKGHLVVTSGSADGFVVGHTRNLLIDPIFAQQELTF